MSIPPPGPKDRFAVLPPNPRYPLAAKYDPAWRVENQMGSDCLCLLESLMQALKLAPGSRVLDLGCGKAMTSIFLAKEFGARVWAVDLKIDAAENWARIKAAGAADRVCPLRADARGLPFADGFFDAVVSVNSLQFYGTDDMYLQNHLIRLIEPGGRIGAIVPGFVGEFAAVPDTVAPDWGPALYNWHSAAWWRWHWEKTGLVRVDTADNLADGDGFRLFKKWEEVMGDSQLCRRDEGRHVTFVRLAARKI